MKTDRVSGLLRAHYSVEKHLRKQGSYSESDFGVIRICVLISDCTRNTLQLMMLLELVIIDIKGNVFGN